MRMLVFTLVATVASALLFGVAPAWQSLRTDLVPALKSAEPGLPIRQRTIGRDVLVVAQVAMSMMLLVATVIMLDGVRRTLKTDPGFRRDHLLMLSTDTSLLRYTPAQTHEFYRTLVEQAHAVPGVTSAALASAIPFGDVARYFPAKVMPDGYQFPKGEASAQVPAAIVDEHYFATARTRIVFGRDFTAADRADSRTVAIVNDQFGKVYWPGQNAVGKRMRLAGKDAGWVEIVGVAETGHYFFVGESPLPFVYFPLALVGLYGLVAYSVARRTRELGIRIAIGASRWDVLKMVLRQGMTLAMAGIMFGGAGSIVVARVLTSAAVGSGNPTVAVYAIVPLLLVGLTLTASYVPARRASRVDPLNALRCD